MLLHDSSRSGEELALSKERLAEIFPAALRLAAALIDNQDNTPVNRPASSAIFPTNGCFPESGTRLEEVLAEPLLRILSDGLNSNSRRYLGEIPGGGLPVSAIADFLTSIANRWPGLSDWAPGLVEIEKEVLLWMCNMFEMPEGSGGILTSGGSLANLSAIHTARSSILQQDFSKGIIYYSELAHNSNKKSARIAGFTDDQLRAVKTDEQGRMCLYHLDELIKLDTASGLKPFMIIATAGTTYTGAVDPLPGISTICKSMQLWMHVDAAWAGSFMLTERGKKALSGIEHADSITFDPHKGFWTPWGCGSLLVKNPALLKDAFFIEAGYLPVEDRDELLINSANISAELSRNTRGLQVWLPIVASGINRFRDCLEERLNLAEQAAIMLADIADMKISFGPSLGIVNIRYEPKGLDDNQINQVNRLLLESFNSKGAHYISINSIRGKDYIHIAPLHFRTTIEDISEVVDLIRSLTSQCTQSIK